MGSGLTARPHGAHASELEGTEPTPVSVPIAAARAAIARIWIEDAPVPRADADGEATLGSVVLRPHQRDAVQQLSAILRTASGALLADEVGLGKTYVALALAREARRPLIIAPAVLHSMWSAACVATAIDATLLSTEALSRSRANGGPLPRADLLIVDEAQHFRTPSTRRYRALAALAATAPIVLLSATPIHNHPRDLAALLALFLGARAWTLDDERRAAYVVRRSHALLAAGAPIPSVDPPVWITVPDDGATLQDILSLPPPVPPRDAGDGGALLLNGLVRQWASSRGALQGALRRRLERAVALTASLERGRYPTYRDLRSWCAGEGAVQLAFPELLVPESSAADQLLPAVRAHAAAVREALDRLAVRADPDVGRVARLRALREQHRGAKIVAFTGYEDTVRALYRLLRADPGVCALWAEGARVAGGALTRTEAIARFAPLATATPAPRAAERIDVLLTTDLLSEGVNLQDASVVVHLDLPWTAARMEQRVGRVARLGSIHARVAVYAFRPPADTELMLRVEERLRTKLEAAGRSVGFAGSILPAAVLRTMCSAADDPPASPVQHTAMIRSIVSGWNHGASGAGERWPMGDSRVWVATVRVETPGALAVCTIARTPTLVASFGGPVTDRASVVARAVRLVGGAEAECAHDPDVALRAHDAVLRWAERRLAQRDAGLGSGAMARERRHVLARISTILRCAPPHRRARIAILAHAARRATVAASGIAAEWRLGELAGDISGSDETWLSALAAQSEERTQDADFEKNEISVPVLVLLRCSEGATRVPQRVAVQT